MLPLSPSVYLTADEIDARIVERKAQAASVPDELTRRQLRREIARLRVYSDMKRQSEMSVADTRRENAGVPAPES